MVAPVTGGCQAIRGNDYFSPSSRQRHDFAPASRTSGRGCQGAGCAHGRHLSAFSQWAQSATASSEYGSGTDSWSAWQATGAANVAPACSSESKAWSPEDSGSGPEYLLVSFQDAVWATQLEVFETYEAPFVTTVEADGPDDIGWSTVWSGTDIGESATCLLVSQAAQNVDPQEEDTSRQVSDSPTRLLVYWSPGAAFCLVWQGHRRVGDSSSRGPGHAER